MALCKTAQGRWISSWMLRHRVTRGAQFIASLKTAYECHRLPGCNTARSCTWQWTPLHVTTYVVEKGKKKKRLKFSIFHYWRSDFCLRFFNLRRMTPTITKHTAPTCSVITDSFLSVPTSHFLGCVRESLHERKCKNYGGVFNRIYATWIN